MNDKVIGILMILFSVAITAFMLVWTLILPIIDPNFLFKAYIAVAVVVFLAIFVVMLLMAWIGLTLIKTKPPEIDLEETEGTEEEKTEGGE